MKQRNFLLYSLFLSAIFSSPTLANDGGNAKPQPAYSLSPWKDAYRSFLIPNNRAISISDLDGPQRLESFRTGPQTCFFADSYIGKYFITEEISPNLYRQSPIDESQISNPKVTANLFAESQISNLKSQIIPDTLPLTDRKGDYLRDSITNPFYLKDPDFIDKKIEYDPITNSYTVTEKIGDDYYRVPTQLTYSEYLKYKAEKQEKDYFEKLAGINRKNANAKVDPFSKIDFSNSDNGKLKMLINSLGVNGKLDPSKFNPKAISDKMVSWIFGSDPPKVDIRPQGQVDLTLGYDYRRYDNPQIPIQGRVTGGLLFDMNININVTGKIGEKLNLNTAFNNRATFDFDNIMKLNYNGTQFSEDDIVKSIEAGNVSLPLRGQLIQGSQNLFGVKTELQFGYLRLTALAAQQKSQRKSLNLQGGAQTQQFTFQADQYDENRHFFLSQLNRNTTRWWHIIRNRFMCIRVTLFPIM